MSHGLPGRGTGDSRSVPVADDIADIEREVAADDTDDAVVLGELRRISARPAAIEQRLDGG